MEIYSLTGKGRALAHSTNAPDNPEWNVIFFLSKHGSATKEQIKSYVPTANGATLMRLKMKGVIAG